MKESIEEIYNGLEMSKQVEFVKNHIEDLPLKVVREIAAEVSPCPACPLRKKTEHSEAFIKKHEALVARRQAEKEAKAKEKAERAARKIAYLEAKAKEKAERAARKAEALEAKAKEKVERAASSKERERAYQRAYYKTHRGVAAKVRMQARAEERRIRKEEQAKTKALIKQMWEQAAAESGWKRPISPVTGKVLLNKNQRSHIASSVATKRWGKIPPEKRCKTEEQKRKMSESHQRRWADPEYRAMRLAKLSAGRERFLSDPERVAARSASLSAAQKARFKRGDNPFAKAKAKKAKGKTLIVDNEIRGVVVINNETIVVNTK